MKETGLMFKAPLVRSILDGSKTQTRRVLKLRPGFDFEERDDGRLWPWAEHPDRAGDIWMPCPLGDAGDRIYVRETHAQVLEPDIPTGRPRGPKGTSGIPARPEWQSHYVYLADGEMPPVQWHHLGDSQPVRWTPSIHMPKRAARTWLDITGVRVERLQDISEEDAKAEGAWPDKSIVGKTAEYFKCHPFAVHPSLAFRMLWESTGGDWAANPWVWVIDFKRIHNHKATP